MYDLGRKLMLNLPPECAHNMALKVLNIAQGFGLTKYIRNELPLKPREVMGLIFSNPVGLAAGMDKNADCVDGLGEFGFGHLELGTVTPRAQSGNAKPRLFRLFEKQALINRMGFNNKGVDYLVNNVKKSHYEGVIGINIGKNADTPLEQANDDYETCFKKVYPVADYVAVNISSPNTADLRSLQLGDSLKSLMDRLKEQQLKLIKEYGKKVPIAIKIAPDLSEKELVVVARALLSYEIEGVIATNTTLSRDKVENQDCGLEKGGLSGAPLSDRSTEVIRILANELSKKVSIIGVGGIVDARTAAEKIQAGASLIQLYTGFIYKGHSLIRKATEASYFE